MRKIACWIVASILIVSCQKEVDGTLGNSNNNPGTGEAKGMLAKATSKSGSDSAVNSYFYDAAGRLKLIAVTGNLAGTVLNNSVRIERNSNGIITRSITKDEMALSYGLDSVIMNVHYDAAKSRYRGRSFEINVAGFFVQDSAVFDYDATGNVISETHYSNFLGSGYQLNSKADYVYTGQNITTVNSYEVDPITGAIGGVIERYVYTFDNHPAAFVVKADAFALGYPTWVNANNVTGYELTDLADATNNTIRQVTYTYNAAGKPSKSVTTDNSGQSMTTDFIYY